jgi:hypothetical protein
LVLEKALVIAFSLLRGAFCYVDGGQMYFQC